MSIAQFLASSIWSGVLVSGPNGVRFNTRNRPITLITKAQTEQLLANNVAQRADVDRDETALDFKTVVKLLTSDSGGHGNIRL